MKIKLKFKVNENFANWLAILGLIFYFNDELLRNIVAKVFIAVNMPGYLFASFIVMYMPIFLLILLYPRKIKADVLLVLIGVLVFFGITYIIHPEYSEWFNHSDYGIYDRVLRFDRAIYAYLFVRTLDDVDSLMKGIKITAIVRFLYYMTTFMSAQINGYWLENDMTGELVKMSYSLSFGYKMLFSSTVFAYIAFIEKSKKYIFLFIISVITILLGGSRGPLIGIALIVFFVFWKNFSEIKMTKKLMFVMVFIVSAIVVLMNYENIIHGLVAVLNKYGISSRSIEMMLSGTLAEGNGRDRIYELAIQMIKDNPFGYGIYGDRYVIGQYYFWGYCHNLVLEILIDFGIFSGSLILITMVGVILNMLLRCKERKYQGVFVIFLVCSVQLMLSSSLWYSQFFWACIAVYINYKKSRKKVLHTL